MVRAFRPRFIPTLVGNGSTDMPHPGPLPVHPHARGERRLTKADVYPIIGSSPRSWGTGFVPVHYVGAARFIPTLVGNGEGSRPRAGTSAVHPHARGERNRMPIFRNLEDGSSPRSWGTGFGCSSAFSLLRFIPTLVGNGSRPRPGAPPAAVHPHARGERHGSRISGRYSTGSSPRSWGTALKRHVRLVVPRFIPTLVGNGTPRPQPRPASAVHPHARGERSSCNLPKSYAI